MEFDKDLTARQEARMAAKAAKQAQHVLADMTQEQLDAIIKDRIARAEAKAVEKYACKSAGYCSADCTGVVARHKSGEAYKVKLNAVALCEHIEKGSSRSIAEGLGREKHCNKAE